MSRPPLSALISAGVDHARFVFGATGEAVPGAALVERGSARFAADAGGDAVGVIMTNDRPTVELVLGAVVVGARLVSLPLPGRGADIAEYVEGLRHACQAHGLSTIVVADEHAGLLEPLDLPVRRHSELDGAPLAGPARDGFTLVQFTSGSTARPRPVVLGDAALGANVDAILSVVQPRPGDALVSWLPLAHDMGLVGMLLTGVAAVAPCWAGDSDLVLLDPRQFLRRPASWLEAVSHWSGTFTAAPDFAFRMAAAQVPAGAVDLGSLRCVIVGGEIVRAETLHQFAEVHAGRGFDPRALCPAYGMAELGLAATMTPPGELWRQADVATGGLADDLVRPAGSGAATALVASGPPLPGYEIRVGDGGSVTTGAIGAISVRGPSLGTDGETAQGFGGSSGWYAPGDRGFVRDGWLHVCGRDDDYVVTHGRNLYAPALEAAVGDVDGVRSGRVTVVGLPGGDWVVVAEAARGPGNARGPDQLRWQIRRAAVAAAGARPDDVVVLAPGSMPMTSSGKLQRGVVRARLLRGEL
jgi:acyl-CoA synthetase (AMP-forming)/AMP-acid ligase II